MGYSVLSKYRSELMGAAMLWVMLFHAFDLDLGLGSLNWLRSAGFGGVDIFIVLSAMGLVLSLSRRETEYSVFMTRRAWRILPAYFAVMLPYTLWKIAQGAAPLSALLWNSSLLYYWVHNQGAFNWYVAGIMTFYALTPLCFRWLRRTKHRILLTGCTVIVGLLICRLLIQEGFWNYLDVFYRVPVFALGLLLGFYVEEDRQLQKGDALFWALWLALGMGYLVLSYRIDSKVLYLPLCHLFLFTTVPMCLTGCFLFERLPLGWLRTFFRLVGKNSLEIYLLNVSVFSEIDLLEGLTGLGPSHRLHYLLMFALNIALGVLLHRGVEALKGKTFLGGT